MTGARVLLLAALGLVPVALTYGGVPSRTGPLLMGIEVESTALTHVFRAVMGLYLANAAFWLAGALRPALRRAALWGLMVFMGGVAAGRALSLVLDGWAGPILFGYLLVELVFVALAARALRNPEA